MSDLQPRVVDSVGPRTLVGLLEAAAVGRQGAVLLRLPDGTTVSYGEFLGLRDRIAAGLQQRGVNAGQVVAVHLHTSVRMLAVLCAVHRIGAIAAMSNPSSTPRELRLLLKHCGAILTITDEVVDEGVEHSGVPVIATEVLADTTAGPVELVQIEPDTPATVLFTSGTTAEPKAVVYTHGHHVFGADVYASLLRLAPDSLLMHHFPLFHMNGLNQLGAALNVGCEILLVERFRSRYFDALLDEFAPTATFLNGTHIKMIRETGTQLVRPSPLRRVGMALQMADSDYDWFESKYGAILTEGYGQTESITMCLVNPVPGGRRASCGLPAPGYQVRVVPDGSDHTGELQIWSGSRFGVMHGYLNDAEATAAVFDDGWLRTGDIVRIEDGFIYYVDREKDIIKRAGENISAREVETVLEQHPTVTEAAVVGRPDTLREELPVAFVVTDTDVTPDALRTFCERELAPHKVPDEFRIADRLPRTAVGKIEKKMLRASIGQTPEAAT